MECGHASRMRLDLADLVGGQRPQAGHLVDPAVPLQRSEPRELRLLRGDDQLPRALEVDAVVLAVAIEAAGSLDTEPRLQRAGRVVDAGVDDATGATCLVGADVILGLQHADPRARPSAQQLPRDGEADDAAPDHGGIALTGRWGVEAHRQSSLKKKFFSQDAGKPLATRVRAR
jgi:hypothetical protein